MAPPWSSGPQVWTLVARLAPTCLLNPRSPTYIIRPRTKLVEHGAFMRSLFGSFRTSVRGTEEHKVLMAHYPEAGPLIQSLLPCVALCSTLCNDYSSEKDCSKKIGNTKDPLCQTGPSSREGNNWDRISRRPTISAIYVTPLQVKLAWERKLRKLLRI